MRAPIRITLSVPADEADDAFAWWMQEYERHPDGAFYEIASQLRDHVTVACYALWKNQFEHPKGVSVISISLNDHRPASPVCQKHKRPIAVGLCE